MAPLATASQVNLLIYHYLKEAGFMHSCFSLRHEARLDDAPGANDAIVEPGTLLRYLQKGLLYAAVEAHPRLAPPPATRLTPTPEPEDTAKREAGAQTSHLPALPRSRSNSRAPATRVNGLHASDDRSSKEASTSRNRLDLDDRGASTAVSPAKRKGAATSTAAAHDEKRTRGADRNVEGINGRAGADDESDEDDNASASRGRNGKSATPSAKASSGKSKSKKSEDANRNGKESGHSSKAASTKSAKRNKVPPLSEELKAKEVSRTHVWRLAGHTAETQISAWNPAVPSLLASGAGDATVRIWDLASLGDSPEGESDDERAVTPIVCKHLPPTHAKNIAALEWNPDGTLLASGSYDGILRLWTPQGDLHLVMSMHQGPIFVVRWNRRGNYVLTGSSDGTAIVWDVGTGKPRQQFSTHSDGCLDVDWLCGPRWDPAAIGAPAGSSPSIEAENTIATASADNSINIVRVGEQRPLRTLRGHTDEVNFVHFDPTGTLLASASDDTTCRIWSLDKILGPGYAGSNGYSASSVPEAADVMDASDSNGQIGDDAEDADAAERGAGASGSSATRHVLRGHTGELHAATWVPHFAGSGRPRMLATSSCDSTVRLWNAEDGSCIRVLDSHSDSIYNPEFSPDARFMATGGIDGRVFITRISDGVIIKAHAASGGICHVAWRSELAKPTIDGPAAPHKRSASDALLGGKTAPNGSGPHSRAKSTEVTGAALKAESADEIMEDAQNAVSIAPAYRSHKIALSQGDKTVVVLDLTDLCNEEPDENYNHIVSDPAFQS
ncbi:Beta-transducin family (WD-40 repeat) protein [Ceraceosorus bombacis]|uniref:Beta-transducin family (WD-40 repeat) protein n=1 Tax=Ceraceosorus bombacis TaxID=401625 RepID=A0A0P1BHX4_9BASI|nr:Beta-transducin family (WD-40 repeat) protein [Ceraceosorus bombacis]